MSNDDRGEALESVLNVQGTLLSIEDNLSVLFSDSKSLSATTESGWNPLEAGKLDVSLAFSLASLYFILVNANGRDTRDGDGFVDGKHPVMSELEKIRKYVGKAHSLEQPVPSVSLKIDKAAAARIISHGTDSKSSSSSKAKVDSVLAEGPKKKKKKV